jgi:hypothetical protein
MFNHLHLVEHISGWWLSVVKTQGGMHLKHLFDTPP